ncbi:hypothetical protein BDA99DRAFT_531055 [Phascolomyces articulosus]|uniref:Uncharacterized protein n=1 Tax=Phascolomyces articulosus TaxID=60185 RepID=A0AAD5KQQ9_9FUNG|nr:hypothetical protein BDA99DRAFT_531055 [Phascolomyces articulosus]
MLTKIKGTVDSENDSIARNENIPVPGIIYDSVTGSAATTVDITQQQGGEITGGGQGDGIPGSAIQKDGISSVSIPQEGGNIKEGGEGAGYTGAGGDGCRGKFMDKKSLFKCICITLGIIGFIMVFFGILCTMHDIPIFDSTGDNKGASTMEHTSSNHDCPGYSNMGDNAGKTYNLDKAAIKLD